MIASGTVADAAYRDAAFRTKLDELDAIRRSASRTRPLFFLSILVLVAAFGLLILLVGERGRHLRREQAVARSLDQANRQLRVALHERKALADELLAEQRHSQGMSAQLAALIAQSHRIDTTVAAIASPTTGSPTAAPRYAVPSVQPIAGTQALTGISASGWDIDVFWCQGAAQARDYAIARGAATTLADAAAASRPLGMGVTAGRIRLRPMAVGDQARQRAGLVILADPALGEMDAAKKIATFLVGHGQPRFEPALDPGSRTKWYLSLFVCTVPAAL